MADAELFRTPEEHESDLSTSGFVGARLLLKKNGLVLFRAKKP
jgi:hypothetical protein